MTYQNDIAVLKEISKQKNPQNMYFYETYNKIMNPITYCLSKQDQRLIANNLLKVETTETNERSKFVYAFKFYLSIKGMWKLFRIKN